MNEKYIAECGPGICSQEDFEHDLKLWRQNAIKMPKTECEVEDLLTFADFLIKVACNHDYKYVE